MTLEMRGICKSFGSNDVLKHVDFSICLLYTSDAADE